MVKHKRIARETKKVSREWNDVPQKAQGAEIELCERKRSSKDLTDVHVKLLRHSQFQIKDYEAIKNSERP